MARVGDSNKEALSMKVGVLGTGRMGELHAGTLAAHPRVDEVLIGSRSRDRAASLAKRVGGSYGTIDGVIDSDIDAVVITTATSEHAGQIESAMEAGLPVFCEKPLAMTLEQTAALVELVESSGLPLQVGFQRRFDAGYKEAKRLIDAGDLGTIYCMRVASHDHEPPPRAADFIPASGGLFRDVHVHDFDAVRWLTGGEVEQVFARAAVLEYEVFAEHGDFDNAATLLQMSTGAMVTITGGRRNPLGYDVRHEVLGSRDSISIGLGERTPVRSVEPGAEPPDHPFQSFLVRFEQAYRAEIRHFVEVVLGRAENPCTAQDSLKALRVAEAAELSVARGAPVSPSDI